MIRIVLDTNVIVSAVLTPFGPPARILDAVLNGNLLLLHDDRIVAEYFDVLNRRKFNFDAELVSYLMDYIITSGEHVSAMPLQIKLKDEFDLPFIEVAISGHADALVTGNKRHFPQKLATAQIATPAEFMEKIWPSLQPI